MSTTGNPESQPVYQFSVATSAFAHEAKTKTPDIAPGFCFYTYLLWGGKPGAVTSLRPVRSDYVLGT